MALRDDGESIGLFEPLMVGEASPHRSELNDLALDLATRSAAFQASLPSSIADALVALIRSVNCYYSNLIEGHHTHPVDIERALKNDYSNDPKKRNLQLEAIAHITVQRWIDDGGLQGRATTLEAIVDIHRQFCELIPPDLLLVEHPTTGAKISVLPGTLRDRDVQVGSLVAVSPGAVPRFLKRFDEAYMRMGRNESILATACAHHRLLWIHPFLDGNGRVARLMSYAMLRETLDTKGLWSVARGLARNEVEYKRHLMACDARRHGDLDGRGTLSESALASFVRFFLQCCIDQITFMESLMKPGQLHDRILTWAAKEIKGGNLHAKSDSVLKAVMLQGELSRSDVVALLGVNERTARRVTSALINSGAITSASNRAPLRLAFPAKLAGHWLPGLFPDQ